jgi:hypothetical protein
VTSVLGTFRTQPTAPTMSVHRGKADLATAHGAVAELVGIEGGVVSGVINLESSGVEASDWRPRHDEHYHEV